MEGTNSFFNFLKMELAMSDEQLQSVAITIRHPVSGDRYPSLKYGFSAIKNTMACLIPDVCQVICVEL
jgi:DNA-directed RNA polymerase subunit L